MDRFDAMSLLLAVVEEGSLSAASRRVRAPLATVSRKVSDLEKHLRTQLLVRTSRRRRAAGDLRQPRPSRPMRDAATPGGPQGP